MGSDLVGSATRDPDLKSCRKKLYQHRPQTASKRFAWTNISQTRFLGTPYLSPKSKLLKDLSMILLASTSLIVRPQEKTREEQDKRRQEEDKTRSQSPATEFRGAPSQCVQGWSARPEDKRRTTAGQEKDKRRTRPGHRVQRRGHVINLAIVVSGSST